MFSFITRRRHGPIGLDIGARWVKLVQYTADRTKLIDVSRAEIPAPASGEVTALEIGKAVERAKQGRSFVGSEVAVCLNDRHLFLQNLRVQRANTAEMDKLVVQEAASRLPYRVEETELRYLEAADVRQAEALLREVIVLACHKPVLGNMIETIEQIGLRPISIDVEPLALVRSAVAQYRRDEDQGQRMLLAHIGYRRTLAVICQGDAPLLIKNIELGGKQLDEAVANYLRMEIADAAALRRSHGDRRAEHQDPDVSRSIQEATRPIIDRLISELGLCIRYHSVTFRGGQLERCVLSGGEASSLVQEALTKHLGLKCELSDPFRALPVGHNSSRRGQWEIAAGLALQEIAA